MAVEAAAAQRIGERIAAIAATAPRPTTRLRVRDALRRRARSAPATRSPGIASATSTTWPSRRAIIRRRRRAFDGQRDDVAGFNVARSYTNADRRQLERARAPGDPSPPRARARERLGGHAAAKSGELVVGLTRQRRGRRAVQRRARLLQQLRVEGRQAIDQRLTRRPRRPPAFARAASSSRRHAIDQRIELVAERPARARRRQPEHDALEMFRQRLTATARLMTAD